MAHTSPGQGLPTGPGVPPPPSKIAAAASSRGLGACLTGQKGVSPISNVGQFLLLAVGCGIGGWLVGWVAVAIKFRELALLAMMAWAAMVAFLALAVRVLVSGTAATYLYENGIVHLTKRTVQVVTWSEVDRLALGRVESGPRRGTLLYYLLLTSQGVKIRVPARAAKGNGSVGPRLEQIVRERGRPVIGGDPATGRPGTG